MIADPIDQVLSELPKESPGQIRKLSSFRPRREPVDLQNSVIPDKLL